MTHCARPPCRAPIFYEDLTYLLETRGHRYVCQAGHSSYEAAPPVMHKVTRPCQVCGAQLGKGELKYHKVCHVELDAERTRQRYAKGARTRRLAMTHATTLTDDLAGNELGAREVIGEAVTPRAPLQPGALAGRPRGAHVSLS